MPDACDLDLNRSLASVTVAYHGTTRTALVVANVPDDSEECGK